MARTGHRATNPYIAPAAAGAGSEKAARRRIGTGFACLLPCGRVGPTTLGGDVVGAQRYDAFGALSIRPEAVENAINALPEPDDT